MCPRRAEMESQVFGALFRRSVRPAGAESRERMFWIGDLVDGGAMVSRMQVLLQSKRLHLPLTVEAGVLAKKWMDYEITVCDRAHASFSAMSGSHDDP